MIDLCDSVYSPVLLILYLTSMVEISVIEMIQIPQLLIEFTIGAIEFSMYSIESDIHGYIFSGIPWAKKMGICRDFPIDYDYSEMDIDEWNWVYQSPMAHTVSF
ncbi:hypothetical protein BDB01DRAFT_831440 [Pilobolus umbonatus]|nr:hypothetical protein BDB01DRAFT_831440 [Pilobolus umbonatus]